MLLCLSLAGIVGAGCAGNGPTPTPTPIRATARPSGTAAPTATVAPSVSTVPTASPTPAPTLPLPHVNAALEDKLPGIIGEVELEKFSWPVSTYVASLKGSGDSSLYTPWLVKFGKTTDDVDMAIAADLTQTEKFSVHAIEVPGASATSLASEFAAVARSKKWPVNTSMIGPKTLLEVVDPVTDAAGGLGTAYVYASGDVLYEIITDDSALLLEAVIKLP
jgi:hypothetical protein